MKQEKSNRIVLLAGKGLSTNIIFHALNERFGVSMAIIEEAESKKSFLKRRVKKLGYIEVIGQVLFQVILVPALRFFSTSVCKSIISAAQFNTGEIDEKNCVHVRSINNASVIELLSSIQPDVIVVNGTRIISKKILSAIKCPIINMHAGITPLYRGVHGAYWAQVNNDSHNCGVTVHLVDMGVDTGDVIYQVPITIEKSDNFTTYPLKQLAAGVPILIKAVKDALEGNLHTHLSAGKSMQWYHPTIWGYVYFRIFKGVK